MKNDLIFIFDSYIHPCVFSQIAEELLKKPAYAAICASGQAKPNRGAIVAARKQVWLVRTLLIQVYVIKNELG